MLIILLLCMVFMGSLFAAAFLRFFQGKKVQAVIWLIALIISLVLFYWAIGKGYITAPPGYGS